MAETHVATVFFVGDRAYKMKKPVKFAFLDFSTREKRKAALQRELELNRRISPEVYLDVVDLIGSDGDPIDHMLEMVRLPADRSLAHLVEAGEVVTSCIDAIARKVALFHGAAACSDEISAVSTAHAIKENWTVNLAEILPFSGKPLDALATERIEVLAGAYIDGRHALFEQRITGGHIKDGHGDLLAADIFCVEPSPAILDCIEFDDRLRWGDVAGDLAFLAMDLERLGRSDLADALFAKYHEYSGETAQRSLIDHYIAYRALIRSKVACLRWGQGDTAAGTEALNLQSICESHLRSARIRLLVIGGMPGTGKSSVAAEVSAELGWPVLRSDVTRKQLAGIAPGEGARSDYGAGIYSDEWSHRTYEAILTQARHLLTLGESVILDASWRGGMEREAARLLAQETFTEIVEVECRCPADVARTRIQEREAKGGDPSDADELVAEALKLDPWPEADVVDTTGGLGESVSEVLDRAG